MFLLTSMNIGKKNRHAKNKLHFSAVSVLPLCSADFLLFSRGMKFENVQTLTDAISDIITDMKWAW